MSSTTNGRDARWPAEASPAAAQARVKATDGIIDGLMRDVVSGLLRRGDRLPSERELAQHFGVSQPTVREAMRVLDVMGVVEVRHGSGVYVNGDTQQFLSRSLMALLQMESMGILDVLEIRGVLGRYSAGRAADHATAADVDRIASYMERFENLESEPDVQSIANAIVGFQLAVSAAAHNPLLYALEAFLVRLVMQFQLAATIKKDTRFWRERAEAFNEDRRKLLDAVRDGDVDRAVAAWDTYLSDQYQLFASDRQLAKVRLSDPKHAETLSSISLEIPILGAAA
jgi:GntR family transcriptional repressor for pyruvate dehydrogenase complex